MDIATNKQVALAFVDSLSAGAPDATLLTEDARWWVPGLGDLDRAGFFAIAERFRSLTRGPAQMTVIAVTAEEDRVAVEARGHAELLDGRAYDNTYHILFRLRDGLICEAREHNNSLVPAMLFGDTLRTAAAALD